LFLYFLVLSLYFIPTCSFYIDCPAFCLFPYCTTHNTNIHVPEGFELAIPASERPHTYALDRADTGIGKIKTHILRSERQQTLDLDRMTTAFGSNTITCGSIRKQKVTLPELPRLSILALLGGFRRPFSFQISPQATQDCHRQHNTLTSNITLSQKT
jgi:hypothetical protein